MLRTICCLLTIVVLGVLSRSGEAKADAARGRILSEQQCSQCHRVHPNEASADRKAPNFPAIAGEPSATEYSLRVFLKTPHPTMPNFMLQPEDIDDLVSYIISLKRH
jgi:cytochrome c